MKNTFVFDKSENDLLDLEEETVIKETGIDTAKVKESIMKEIKSGKKTKKNSIKKIFSIAAIAAAITAAATITVQAATGVFNSVFGEIFAGQPANGVFPGSDVSVKSDMLDIDFLGITGDETEMFSIYNITKKDGSSFVDTTENYLFLGTYAEMNVTESPYKMLKSMLDGGYSSSDGVIYDFVDEKTIRAFVVYSDTRGCIKGEKLTVTDTETNFFHIDEVLYSDASDTFLGCTEYMEKNETLIKQKTDSLHEDQTIMPIIDEGHAKLAVLTQTTIPFEYELSAKLNYKTTEKSFANAQGKTFNALNTDWTVDNITAGSFSLKIDVTTEHNNIYKDFDMDDQENWSEETLHEYLNTPTGIRLTITLKDRTIIYAEANATISNTEQDGNGKMSWRFTYYQDGNSTVTYALDPEDIVSIKCGETELI